MSVTVSGGAIQILAWVLSWARPGPIPGPRWSRPDSPCALFYSVSDPSRSRGGGHPGPSWSHPAPERSCQDRAWTGRNRLLGHFRAMQEQLWNKAWNGALGRGCDEAEISEEKRAFTQGGQGIRQMKALVSTGKAIQ